MGLLLFILCIFKFNQCDFALYRYGKTVNALLKNDNVEGDYIVD